MRRESDLVQSHASSRRAEAASVFGIPAAALAALPACPACYPLYAGVLSSLGLAPLLGTGAQTVLSVAFLTGALAALVYRAKARRGYLPFAVGTVASLVVVGGKFGLGWDALTYAGVSLLIGASLWNIWPQRGSDDCSARVGGVSAHANSSLAPSEAKQWDGA